ncbi:hypothetical protein [Nocardia sp. NPDC004750]
MFDADKDEERLFVAESIKSQIVDDLLLNVLFGRLSAMDIELFLNGCGIPGLLAATLEEIVMHGFLNFPALGKSLGMSPSTLRPRVFLLVTAGMLEQGVNASYYRASPRARVFLRICHLLLRGGDVEADLRYILERLGLGSRQGISMASPDQILIRTNSPEDKLATLMFELNHAMRHYDARFTGDGFALSNPRGVLEPPNLVWIGR